MMGYSTLLPAWIVVIHCPRNGSEPISRIFIKCQYEFFSMKQADVKFGEENQSWLDEWLLDNSVKTLAECKRWKEYTVELEQPVEGLVTVNGFGCPDCKYAHDRERDVAGLSLNSITRLYCGDLSARRPLVLFCV
jgi:hypothetical protein